MLNRVGDADNLLSREVERIRESGILGDARLRRLFEYLASSSLQGHAPKEITIAMEVFGKGVDFDVSQDALVRVYIHKLRRTLGDYYSKAGGGVHAMHIPRGEYRLVVTVNSEPEPDPAPRLPESVPLPPHRSWRRWLAPCLMLLLGALIGAGILWLQTPRPIAPQIRTNPIWSWLQHDDRPTVVVVGDYYLVGETDDSMEVKRLIREYSVNSKSDLDLYVQQHPGVANRYIDVGLRYIPTAVAYALRDVMPVLAADGRHVAITMMSDVTPNTLKTANIVYIGYLSGMGIMKDWIFTGSRFAIGESYDELIDTRSKHHYISQTASQNMGEPRASGAAAPYRDYGLFSIFRGPGGNTIVVIAGTRDEGVRQTAELFTNPTELHEALQQTDLTLPAEALVEVTALDGVNLTGKLLVATQRGSSPHPPP